MPTALTPIVDTARRRLLEVLSGGTEPPAYIAQLANGDDTGFFAVDGAVWAVHCHIATLVAGPRALLMQALHPGAMAGVHDHSRYREDPFGRLAGTIRWISTVSYGSTEQARAACGWVQRLHEHVRGEYDRADGTGVAYSANDPDLASWVHIAFADSFLRAYLRFADEPVPGGPDAYVREWAIAGELMGVPDPPHTVAELDARLDAFRASGVLRSDARVRDAARFIRRPPLPSPVRYSYPLIFSGAVETLQPWARGMLGLRRPTVLRNAATSRLLAATATLLGPATAPLAAQERIARLAGESVA